MEEFSSSENLLISAENVQYFHHLFSKLTYIVELLLAPSVEEDNGKSEPKGLWTELLKSLFPGSPLLLPLVLPLRLCLIDADLGN